MESFSFNGVAGAVFAILLARLSLGFIKVLIIAFQRDLGKIPGPVLSRFTGIPLKIAVLFGRRSIYIQALHEQYGSYVRIAPQEIHTADIEAFKIIHRVGSDWDKGLFYQGQIPSQTTDETAGVFGIRNNKAAFPRRRLFQSAGTKKVVVGWEPEVQELTALAVQKIKRDLHDFGSSDVMKWWTLMSSDVTGSLAFGGSFDNTKNEQKNRLIHDVEMLLPIIGLRAEMPWTKLFMDYLPAWCPGSLKPFFRRYKSYGENAVQATRMAQEDNKKTVFSKMVLEEESEQTIPDSIIEREAANFIVAGTDTTTMTLTYLVYAVLSNPHIKQKLVEEIQSCTANPNWEELEGKTYLNNVIQETMRLHPAVPGSLTRLVPPGRENALKYVLPVGTEIGTQAWTFQRDPNVFEEPLRFNPDRWLSATPAMKEHMMPFGGPARICVGQNIARLTILHATSKLFRECPDIKLSDSTTEESMQMVDYFAIKPKAGKCVIVPDNT